jgi:hypothetical protein
VAQEGITKAKQMKQTDKSISNNKSINNNKNKIITEIKR